MKKILISILMLSLVVSLTLSANAQETVGNEQSTEVDTPEVRIRISAIMVKTETEANEIFQRLNEGMDFSEMARQYSIGAGKDEGGDLGYFAPGEMMKELDSQAANLQIGEYSGTIKTGRGYFILMKTEEIATTEYEKMKEAEVRWNVLSQQAMQLYQQSRYGEAISIAKQALKVAEEIFGPDHPDVAQSLNNLAELYHDLGNYSEAEPLYLRALSISERTFGRGHPSVAVSLNNLAGLYHTQGKYAEAEPLFQRALAIREKALGPDHPNVATVLENMAELYRKVGKEDEAVRLEERAEEIRSKSQ